MPVHRPTQQKVEKEIASRRTHRKSRLGCLNCKRRRIKCDETKPSCSNCVSHSIHCKYAAASQPATTRPIESEAAADHGSQPDAPVASLNLTDLELLHNYYVRTSKTFGEASTFIFWEINAPQIGFSYPFVLHLILGFSALHIARTLSTSQADRERYIFLADQHYGVAIDAVTELLPRINTTNGHALYLAAMLICFFSFARGPQPDEFIAFSAHGPAEWLGLYKGMRFVVETSGNVLFEGPLAPMLRAARRSLPKGLTHNDECRPVTDPDAPSLRPGEHERMQALRPLVDAPSPFREAYRLALDNLSCWYTPGYLDGSSSSGGNSDDCTDDAGAGSRLPLFFTWIYILRDDFVACLQAKEPIALIVFAHFAVLLRRFDSLWVLAGWAQHIISGIYDFLDEGWRGWLAWPAEQIGWTQGERM
ncbi:uncharacterized protein K452DRAFT_313167 [Aplosporella prunicola CBS 121167]|uniref:Zn(2)-C6 fungal-type domain-containing protein n=1 Tax=Aplosporella prunicola CBS 121167 TaxID=1176127 RepID=A0A6A6AWV5_9PEZI|nr:uncharacterized protein K452DRAFT_313167 [Aplosporella prunicola CBS 121167]KAF2136472.1 hypothetical protein K452DRAFT_313167 [Aplosporella prunicola CBS 121167]